MQASDIPTLISEYFAKNTSGSFIRTVPGTTTTPGAASFDQGFPSECFTDPNAGGFPPDGRDFNYLHQFETRWLQWLQAGGMPAVYNSSFQTAIGGYWNGAVIASVTFSGTWWRSTVDNNVTNPDTGGAEWVNAQFATGGGGKLAYVSTTQVSLGPNLTPWLVLNGANVSVAAGITAANTGVLVNGVSGNLAANTSYYATLYWTGAALALAFWAIGTYTRMADTFVRNIGTQVVASGGTPNSSHSIVGMVRTNVSGQFQAEPLTRSYFGAQGTALQTAAAGTAVGTPVIHIGGDTSFLCFGDEVVDAFTQGSTSLDNTSETDAWIAMDGVATNPQKANMNGQLSSWVGFPFNSRATYLLTDGLHTASLWGNSGTGGTTNFNGSVSVAIQRRF